MVIALLLSLVPAVLADESEDPTTGQIKIVHSYTGSENNSDFLNKMDVPGPDYNVAVQNESFVLPRPTTSDMTVGDKTDTSVIPYFWDDDGYKWVVTSYEYRYYDNSSTPTTSAVNLSDEKWNNITLKYYAPYTYSSRNDSITVYSAITYTWVKTAVQDSTHAKSSVTYDFNLPTGAHAYYVESVLGIPYAAFAEGYINGDTLSSLKTTGQKMNEGAEIPYYPTGVMGDKIGLIGGIPTTENGNIIQTYYQFDGWMMVDGSSESEETQYVKGEDENDLIYTEGNMPTVNGNVALVAHWTEVVFDNLILTDEQQALEVPFAVERETGTDAMISQHSSAKSGASDEDWTTENSEATALELEEDREVYYKAELSMNPLIAEVKIGDTRLKNLLADRDIQNPAFASFDIKVQLDEALEPVADNNGYVTFRFTCTFLQPMNVEGKTGVIKNKVGEIIYNGGYTTDGDSYVYTVPASVLKNNTTFIIPMEWKPGKYSAEMLTQEICLEVAATKVSGEEEQTVVTTGVITGRIDLAEAGVQETDVVSYLMVGDTTWKNAFKPADNNWTYIDILKAAKQLKNAMANIILDANSVYAHVDGPEQPTGTLTVTKYVADNKAVEGQEYTFTATINGREEPFTLKAGETWTKSGIALDTTYSIKETNSNGYNTTYYNEAGIITEGNPDAAAVVINVPRDEGALVISKTVNGGSLTKEFTFTVELSAEGEYHYTGSKTGTIASGETVTLKNGESISINNLPEGTTYTVTETAEDDYTTTVSGHDATDPCYGNTASGTIVAGAAAVVHYTNTYQYTSVIPDPPIGPTTPTTPVEPSKPELNLEDHVAYIIGYVDGTVRPLNDISRSEVATIFFRLLTDESRAYYWSQTNPHSDVDADDWFNNAISTLSNAGIITGYPDGTFRPDAPITRSEFAAIAARFSEVVWNGGNSFSDVPENHWAARYIALAEHLGWITGYPDGTFRPEQNITRAESMTLINRVLERAVEEEHMLPDMVTWVDNVPGTWYYEAVQEATNSHEYVRLAELVPGQDFCYEDWQEILAVPDWAALERTWSTANSK